ncbi:hypothetical protein LBBP_03606 [Leptospira borgpetersenii serovar Ballum]|uniref:Uncharacterized protein n=1 Tax=Leptospira borgpetersenii serovar Ballum TaxID=280505 RepID=A0A0S2IVW0_LEPBO|nr:hypothetical protein LBBP_03606 [Leptospira borgpetersenii serovar Ballum]
MVEIYFRNLYKMNFSLNDRSNGDLVLGSLFSDFIVPVSHSFVLKSWNCGNNC